MAGSSAVNCEADIQGDVRPIINASVPAFHLGNGEITAEAKRRE
jgi:hypothetical protein